MFASALMHCTQNRLNDASEQGNVDKVVMVIKNKEDLALERFIFAVETMIEVEAFNKDTR